MTPERIQCSRKKGYRLPEGAIYVGRPTRFGNPYSVALYGRASALALFENTARGIWDGSIVPRRTLIALADEAHTKFLERLGGHPIEVARSVLAGHPLACWCALEDPCHADIWLAIANPGAIVKPAVPKESS